MKKLMLTFILLISMLFFIGCPEENGENEDPIPGPTSGPTSEPGSGKVLEFSVDYSINTGGVVWLDLSYADTGGLNMNSTTVLERTFEFDILLTSGTLYWVEILFQEGDSEDWGQCGTSGFHGTIDDGEWNTITTEIDASGNVTVTFPGDVPVTTWGYGGEGATNLASIQRLGIKLNNNSGTPPAEHNGYIDNFKLFETATPANVTFNVNFEDTAGTVGWYHETDDAIVNDSIVVVDAP